MIAILKYPPVRLFQVHERKRPLRGVGLICHITKSPKVCFCSLVAESVEVLKHDKVIITTPDISAGMRVKYPEGAFNIAAAAIGRPDFHIHDLRRCAALRMAELGIPETDAMELLGMETRSIFTRNDISSGARKVRVVERLAGALDAEPRRKVAGELHKHYTVGLGRDVAQRRKSL